MSSETGVDDRLAELPEITLPTTANAVAIPETSPPTAAIAIPDEKWDERPMIIVQPMPGKTITEKDILDFYEGKIAKWMIPDKVVFTETIPLGATGKILKNKLRDMFVKN